MSKSFRWTLLLLLGILILLLAYRFAPKHLRYAMEDQLARLTAPNFMWSPALIKSMDKAKLVQEYEERGFQLRCSSELRDYEKIDPTDDTMCWAIIKTAYDNIPANMVAFFFKQDRLSHIRLEFPEQSFSALQTYTNRALKDFPRVDQLDPTAAKDADGFPIQVWETQSGLIMTQAESHIGEPLILLWRHREGEPRYLR